MGCFLLFLLTDDLADASLYWLAAETDVKDIMTADVADFTRYRLPGGQAFSLLG